MVKIELKDGTKLNCKYKTLVVAAKANMVPIRDLTEFQFAKSKTEFVKECLKVLGNMYSLSLQPRDLHIPTYREFSKGILTQLSIEKQRDNYFMSFNFTGKGWRLIRLDSRTNANDVKRVNALMDEIGKRINGGIKKGIKTRSEFYQIPYEDETKKIR